MRKDAPARSFTYFLLLAFEENQADYRTEDPGGFSVARIESLLVREVATTDTAARQCGVECSETDL